MKIMLLAGALITLPAICVIVFYFGRTSMMIPALASLAINLLPFIVAGWLLRGSGPESMGH